MDRLSIRGAREHNLKDIDIDIPLGAITAVTGVSGSGKSSLAFDTIYAEGQRRYIESLSTYARQFIEKLGRPDIDSISGISPTIAIRQKNTVTSARSTVGTATEIYDFLRLLFARAGRIVCPECGEEVRSWSPSEIAREVASSCGGERLYLTAPYRGAEDDTWEGSRKYLLSRGYTRILFEGAQVRIDEFAPDRKRVEDLDILLDRLTAGEDTRSRIAEAAETAYGEHEGVLEVRRQGTGERRRFTSTPSCTSCGRTFEEPSPLLFSFNSPYGACPECKGFGDRMEFSEEMIVPDAGRSIEERAVDPWARERFEHFYRRLLDFCRKKKIDTKIPWMKLPPEDRTAILEGEGDYPGVIPFLERMKEKSYKKGHRFFTRRYMGYTRCRSCRGTRLRREALHVRIAGRSIAGMAAMVPEEILDTLEAADLSPGEAEVSADVISEIESRLGFMIDVGLGYLTLDRLTRSLSGGEAQRINLANSLGADLVDTMYVLDEPSIGLHAADNRRLISVMRKLRDSGNSVIVVEHDPEIIRSADYIVDLGPGPGRHGGEVVYSGPLEEAFEADDSRSPTLEMVFGRNDSIDLSRKRRPAAGGIVLEGVDLHNLKKVDVTFPLGNLVCVTGVSGSGKSSLVVDVLYRLLEKGMPSQGVAGLSGWKMDGELDRALLVDQSPIGSTPRSNPVTYIKGFSWIRRLLAGQRKAMARGYKPGRFSFNKPGGRCPRCDGMGYRRVEMHFMADVFVPCEECGGKRYNRETLEIEYRGRNIADILEMTVDEAILFFDEMPQLGERLWFLARTGLGYLRLGQPSNTLSGGEAQRIKIARELAESSGERNIYVMDEPTTGMHMKDVGRLLDVIGELIGRGHSVIAIEHNMDFIARADHLIDLGPGGGDDGGRVIACGEPGLIVRSKDSITGRYLEEYVKKYGREN